MAKLGKHNIHCQEYLNQRTRIKNKKRKLLKRIKNLKQETQENILTNSPIGRRKEKEQRE